MQNHAEEPSTGCNPPNEASPVPSRGKGSPPLASLRAFPKAAGMWGTLAEGVLCRSLMKFLDNIDLWESCFQLNFL